MVRKLTQKMIYNLFKFRSSEYPILTPLDIETMLRDFYGIEYTSSTVRTILKEVAFCPVTNPDGFLKVAESRGRDTLYYLKGETMKKRRFVIGWE
jgi:hypothetical protein|tara:strand:+ start:192 stop:476 length:285 start_codon:yes stop_codon:yes gene_type:complete